MPVTFEVDEVPPAASCAPTIPLRDLVGEHAFLGIDPELTVLDDRTHPLIGAVHHAFVDHRPLVLSPDAVWLTITQGIAQHVRIHAEALRPRLVAHAGKQLLEIALLGSPQSAEEWGLAIAEFRQLLARSIGDDRARLLTCDFSTTGDAERIASEVVLMDIMSSYYDYAITMICGIPRITLTGTPDDWKKIRARIDVVAELDLAVWARSLARIADELVAAASGQPNAEFFRAIYKPRRAYGWDRVTGWIARLYPYIQSSTGDYSQPNPLLEVPFEYEAPESDGYFEGPGIRTSDPPPGASRALVRMRIESAAEIMTVEGGLLAVEQTPLGELLPRAGFVVRVNHGVAYVIEKLRHEHHAVPGDPSDGARWHRSAQHRELFEAIGSATIQLRDATWSLLPPSKRTYIMVARDGYRELVATRVIDLGDGTTVAIAERGHVIRLRCDRLVPFSLPPPVVPALGEIDPITGLAYTGPPDMTGHVDEKTPAELCELASEERLEAIPVLAPSLIDFLACTFRHGVDLRSTTTLLDASADWLDSPYHAAPLLDRLRRNGKVVDGAEKNDFFGAREITVGTSTWRPFQSPPEWRYGPGSIEIAELYTVPVVDLGDGTFLARITLYPEHYPEPYIVRLARDAIVVTPIGRGRRVHLESSQPLEAIPILGRSIVDVLTFASEHDRLPRAVETLAELRSRSGLAANSSAE